MSVLEPLPMVFDKRRREALQVFLDITDVFGEVLYAVGDRAIFGIVQHFVHLV